MALNNFPHREEYLKKKRKRRIIKYTVAVLTLVLTLGLLAYISHRPNIRISKVTLSGGTLVTAEDVSSDTLTFVQGSYFWLFPKNNAAWYPHKALARYLKDKFKRIDTIDMHLEDFHTLAISITERKPVATWCSPAPGENIVMEDGSSLEEHCYFIDQDSTIFAVSPQFSGDAYFKYYGLVTSDSPIGQQYVASSSLFSDIANFIDTAKKLYIHPLYLVAKDDGQFDLVLAGGGVVYFDTKEPLSRVAENLEALLRTPALSTSTSYNLPVQYIDLRYGNKLFYKLK